MGGGGGVSGDGKSLLGMRYYLVGVGGRWVVGGWGGGRRLKTIFH